MTQQSDDTAMQFQARRVGSSGGPEFSVDFADPAVNQNPFPVLHQIREMAPAVYNPVLDWWLIGSYKHVTRTLANYKRFGSEEKLMIELFGGVTMEAMDPPRHTAVRNIWSSSLQRDEIEGRQQAMIRRVIDDRMDILVDRLASGEVVDAMPGFTRAIPMLVIAHMLGVPPEDFEQFANWSYDISGILDGMTDPTPVGEDKRTNGAKAVAALNGYVAQELNTRRMSPPMNELISKLAHADAASEMSEKEQQGSVTQLVFAGHETTAVLMAHTLVALAQHPDQRQAIIEDRSLIPQALEEVHRWQTVVCANWRYVRGGDVDIDGVTIPDGAMILNLQQAANRDPARWENPDTFDIFRTPRMHVGYAFGHHSCIGINLARLETQIWLDKLLDRIPHYELATDEINYGSNFIVRGPMSVPISI